MHSAKRTQWLRLNSCENHLLEMLIKKEIFSLLRELNIGPWTNMDKGHVI